MGELCLANYLTNIPRARMRHEGERNNCFSKIQQVGKKISRLNNFRKLKLDFNPPLPPKHYKHGGAFRY